MRSKVQKWGNSQGVRIPKNLLGDCQIKVGEDILVTVQDGKIIIEAFDKAHGRYDIKDLVAKMPKGYNSGEEFQDTMGREVW